MIPVFKPFLLLALLLFPVSAAYAQEQSESTPEDIAIAFFQTGKTNPDFDKWALGNERYKFLPPTHAAEFLVEEKQRLIKRWRSYDAEDDLLTVAVNVPLKLKTEIEKDGKEHYRLHISFYNEDIPYFPYTFQDYKFAVIAQKLEEMLLFPIQKEQYDLLLREFNNAQTGQGRLYLQLKPIKAYMNQPYKFDNIEQWVLLTNIANMNLRSIGGGNILFAYTAPWYVSPITKEMETIYQRSQMDEESPVTMEPAIP